MWVIGEEAHRNSTSEKYTQPKLGTQQLELTAEQPKRIGELDQIKTTGHTSKRKKRKDNTQVYLCIN